MNPGTPRVDIAGQRFGRLVALRIHSKAKRGYLWECQCDCGETKLALVHALRNHTRSCGCLHRDTMKTRAQGWASPNRKAPGVAAFNGLLSAYRNSAKDRCLPFELTPEQFAVYTSQPCLYCGTPAQRPFVRKGKNPYGQYLHNGIDRLDSDKGYVLGNCVPCCTPCNLAKASMPLGAFVTWIDRLVAHRNAVPLEESLLKVVIDNEQQFACADNAAALTHLEGALECLHRRTKERVARGVEGTNTV